MEKMGGSENGENKREGIYSFPFPMLYF